MTRSPTCGATDRIYLKYDESLRSSSECRSNFSTGRDESEAQSLHSNTSAKKKTDLKSINAMPKALESVSNVSTISPRTIQFRSISATKVLALALFFAIAALSAVFLLLQ